MSIVYHQFMQQLFFEALILLDITLISKYNYVLQDNIVLQLRCCASIINHILFQSAIMNLWELYLNVKCMFEEH